MPKNQTPKSIQTRQQKTSLLNGPLDTVLTNLGAPRGTAAHISSHGNPNGRTSVGTAGMTSKERSAVLALQLVEKSKQ